jgi:hypothetical protein
MTALWPIDSDGDWVGECLEGLAPSELTDEWLPLGEQEVREKIFSKFRLKGHPTTVMVALNPVKVKADVEDKKQVSYHVAVFRDSDGKMQAPKESDINRARATFFLRGLEPSERIHEGKLGETPAYHFITLITHKPKIYL